MDRTLVGKRIKEARESIHIEQRELASKLGVSVTTACQWERSNTYPKLENLIAIAQLTGKEVSWFFNDSASSEAMTKEEMFILCVYRSLNQKGQTHFMEIADNLRQLDKYR